MSESDSLNAKRWRNFPLTKLFPTNVSLSQVSFGAGSLHANYNPFATVFAELSASRQILRTHRHVG